MTASLAAVVLAGGLSSRLGGGDKPLLELGAGSILETVLDRLHPQCRSIAINANRNLEQYRRFDLPILQDRTTGYAGPLAGLQAGLDWAIAVGARALLTVAGDTPFFPADLLKILADASEDGTIAVASSNGRLHPTFALWPTSLSGDLDRFLENGNRRVLAFIERHPNVKIDFPIVRLPGGQVDPFFNINTPDDLAWARRLLETSTA